MKQSRLSVFLLLFIVLGVGLVSANRLLACLSKFFKFAAQRAEIDLSPALGIESDRDVEKARERFLSSEEIKVFWKALDKPEFNKTITDIIRILLLTSKRRGETVLAKWEHIDLEKRTWFIPAENAKNKVAHTIPLNTMALHIFKSRTQDGEYIFPSPRPGQSTTGHIGVTAISHFLRKNLSDLSLEEKATPHDLRRTALTILSKNQVRPDVREKILNHTDQSTMGRHYDQYDYMPEMRVAMDKLNNHIVAILEGKKKKAEIVAIG